MFVILEDKTICLTRGDIAYINVSANLQDGQPYTFAVGDVVRFRVFEKKDYSEVLIKKDVKVEAETQTVMLSLKKEDTKIGDITYKPTEYCYEIELNPDSDPQTIVGYDEDGEKVFRLYPEGSDTV